MGKDHEERAHKAVETTNDATRTPATTRLPTPEEVDRLTSSGHLVQTAWTINYDRMFGKKDAPLKARTPESALYVHEVNVSPQGEPGRDDPAPHRFHGVALAATGAAPLGSFAHPKGRGGSVSASIGYGAKPSFEFTVVTKNRTDRAEEKDKHKAMVMELSLRVDKFVDEDEAQAELDRVVKDYFPNGDVTATIKPLFARSGARMNTKDLKYGALTSDRTFRLRVAVPSASTNRSLSAATTSGGETTSYNEHATTTGAEDESSLSTKTETQRTKTVEDVVSNEIAALAEKVRDTEWENDQSWQHTSGKDTSTGSDFTLKNAIKGSVGLGKGILGTLVSKIADATLNLDVNTEMGTTSGVKIVDAGTQGGHTGFKTTTKERSDLATKLNTVVKTAMVTSLKSEIATAIRSKNMRGTADKQGGGRKDVQNATHSTTVGRIDTVAADVQPHLEED